MSVALTAEQIAAKEATLAKLEKAYDDYIAGEVATTVSYDGYSVTVNRTNLPMIRRRIRELKRELGQTVSRRSFGVVF